MLEANKIDNFNVGFSSSKSDVVMHLSQWQYWWWFWFALCWVLYFFILIRVINKRLSMFNPTLNTSLRGHGKWGDFLVAIIPLTWCGNILINSNFILRMIEWQNENSLLTIRVIGRQWFWEYRFDSTNLTSLESASQSVGNRKLRIIHPRDYLNEEILEKSLSTTLDNRNISDHYNRISSVVGLQERYNNKLSNLGLDVVITPSDIVPEDIISKDVNSIYTLNTHITDPKFYGIDDCDESLSHSNSTDYYEKQRVLRKSYLNHYCFNHFKDIKIERNINHETINLFSLKQRPLTIVNPNLNEHMLDIFLNNSNQNNIELKQPLLYTLKFWNITGSIENKIETNHLFWGFRQKRLTKTNLRETSNINNELDINDELDINNENDYEDKSLTQDSLFSIRNNRHRGEQIPVNLAKRLLLVKRNLVLPAHVNISIITNSYDVVHSWFIPGLGLKLDCVPGRSTHHSLYIDSVGFYYGQCAEICGRYHHHMPISICALPFEHFLIWWQRKGLHRLAKLPVFKDTIHDEKYASFKYCW